MFDDLLTSVHRLFQLSGSVDIFLSHDWPQQICRFGDSEQLFARKAFLRDEVRLAARVANDCLLLI